MVPLMISKQAPTSLPLRGSGTGMFLRRGSEEQAEGGEQEEGRQEEGEQHVLYCRLIFNVLIVPHLRA